MREEACSLGGGKSSDLKTGEEAAGEDEKQAMKGGS
jgi:hypothetical protein